jgi:5'-nucleotidase
LSAKRPLILLTNDDGVRSPGLLAAAEAVCELGDLLIVAPTTQQTGMGRATSPVLGGTVSHEPLTVRDRDVLAYGLNGSPAQAVLYGLLVLAPRWPDLVISGINYGENLGTCVTASGTVGAALEAAVFGIPALAVSLETIREYHYHHGQDVDWRVAAHITRYFAEAVVKGQLPFDVDVLKIDVPADATVENPWRITRQSRQPYYKTYRAGESPANGKPARLDYRVAVEWETVEPDSDIQALAGDRAISVTPLSLDLTARTDLKALEERLRGAQHEV